MYPPSIFNSLFLMNSKICPELIIPISSISRRCFPSVCTSHRDQFTSYHYPYFISTLQSYFLVFAPFLQIKLLHITILTLYKHYKYLFIFYNLIRKVLPQNVSKLFGICWAFPKPSVCMHVHVLGALGITSTGCC